MWLRCIILTYLESKKRKREISLKKLITILNIRTQKFLNFKNTNRTNFIKRSSAKHVRSRKLSEKYIRFFPNFYYTM